MSIGQPILKMCHSMCMALSTFQNQMCHPIHSKQKVGQACSILFAGANKIQCGNSQSFFRRSRMSSRT